MVEVNVAEVREYNKNLREKKEEASRLSAKLEFNKSEFNRRCEELSKELGVPVNEGNIESIFAEYNQKIRQALDTGNAILQKIARGEVEDSQPQVQQTPVQQTPVQQTPVQQTVAPQMAMPEVHTENPMVSEGAMGNYPTQNADTFVQSSTSAKPVFEQASNNGITFGSSGGFLPKQMGNLDLGRLAQEEEE